MLHLRCVSSSVLNTEWKNGCRVFRGKGCVCGGVSVCFLLGFFSSLLHQSLKLLKCFLPSLQPVYTEPYVLLCFVACGSVDCFFGCGLDSERYSAALLNKKQG